MDGLLYVCAASLIRTRQPFSAQHGGPAAHRDPKHRPNRRVRVREILYLFLIAAGEQGEPIECGAHVRKRSGKQHVTRFMEFLEVPDVLIEVSVPVGRVDAVVDNRIQPHACAGVVSVRTHPGHRPHATKRHIASNTRLPTAVADSPRLR